MSNQQRMDEIASQFGDQDKISMFLGREKIYPAKELSDATLERLENALRSPESEKGTLRVLQETVVSKKAELIYRSSQNALDFDPKNIAPQFQASALSQAPETTQVEQIHTTEQNPEKERSLKEQALENIIIPKNTIDISSESSLEDSNRLVQDFSTVEDPVGREQKFTNVAQNQSITSTQQEPGGAIVLARQNKEAIPFPVNPTQPALDEKMHEILNPSDANNHGSLEQALAAANARIDALQTQLEDTKKSLQDLSKFVGGDNLKSWAEHKAQEITTTSLSIAEQAKNKVMQWMQAKTVQVKEAVSGKVNEVKVVAQGKVNEVKTLAQDKVAEVKTAAQLKAIELKESVKEQANKFLAPINSEEVERAAKYVVRAYGDGKSYDKAATHSFQLNDKNELSIARQADGAVVYKNGEITTAANSRDILKLNALPAIVDQIKVTQMQPFPKREMEVGG